MRCSDIEVLLSAYANDELARTQREFVEEHIATCADCRGKLADYTDIRRHLVSLSETPALKDVKEATMFEIKHLASKNGSMKWLRPALVLAPVVVALAVLMTWQPWGHGPQNAIAKAEAAAAGLSSYRIALEGTVNADNQTSVVAMEIEFVAPDRYHETQIGGEDNLEFMLIGDTLYAKNGSPSLGTKVQLSMYASTITREYSLNQLKYLTGVNAFPDEIVDGTLSLHYRGTLDSERQLTDSWNSRQPDGLPPPSVDAEEKMLKEVRSMGPTIIELWIGKDDYLVRRMKRTTAGNNIEASLDLKFNDFNMPFTIEAPIDPQGNLLPGWASSSPEQPATRADIKAYVDNYDPSNRTVVYSVGITNISQEPLNDLTVRFVSVFPNKKPGTKIWTTWTGGPSSQVPLNLPPVIQRLDYESTFGYDATSIPPDMIADTIRSSYIEISYVTLDGQPKTETLPYTVPDSIYSLPTELPPNLTPLQLKVSGEYRVDEPGATYAGRGVSGKIDGKEYLFVEVNTQGVDKPASPGILVLDIQDEAHPLKVSYLSTGDNTKYISGASLSGTVLYASIDNWLWVIDVSNPSSPRELTRLPGLSPYQTIVSGEYAFISDGNKRVVTLDISDPARPVRIGSLPLHSFTGTRLYLQGNYLFAQSDDSFFIIDASTPAVLQIVNEHYFKSPIDGSATRDVYPLHIIGTEMQGQYAYFTLGDNQGKLAVAVLDMSDPLSPREIRRFVLKDRTLPGELFLSDKRAYVFARPSSGADRRMRLVILDISNPTNIAEHGYGIMPDMWSFFPSFEGRSSSAYNTMGRHLYWFVGNTPNQPRIEIMDLP